MSLDLPTELEVLINEKVSEGTYASPSEVVAEALRLLQERDRERFTRLETLRRDLNQGIEELERGEAVVLDEGEIQRMRVESVRLLESERATRTALR